MTFIIKQLFSKKSEDQSDVVKEFVEDVTDEKAIFSEVDKNRKVIEDIFGESIDFSMSEILFSERKGFIIYFSSMTNSERVLQQLKPSLSQLHHEHEKIESLDNLKAIRDSFFSDHRTDLVQTFHECVWHALNGAVVLFLEGFAHALVIEVGGLEHRSISEPSTQTIIRGPKDAFVESLDINLSLIRRRVKNPRLTFRQYIVGSESRTAVVIGYIDGLTNPGIVKEVEERIEKIDIYAILDSGNVEEMISDSAYTPFPLIFNTERPDSIAANLMEGKVAILVDGSPFALLVPCVFTDFFQATEDYYQPYFMSSFIRLVRYSSFMISLVLPSLYVALTTYHVELFPTTLLISIQSQREGVPFPAVVEILAMELTFEVLREAGIRMPRAVGQTVSIVGALVIGQAAVEAGLVSNVLVIIVAFTAISSFVSPIYNFSISTRLLRFVLIIGASIMGLYAVLLLLVVMVVHLTSLRSFGVSYLTPVAPLTLGDQDDVFVRFPVWANKKKPSYLKQVRNDKMVKSVKPSPPSSEGDQT
ncbi:spore germination protein [Metabacillus herbersteinensis]|uniref:Spore germination protein n=1 Tax=Metabacillus herbersteinensis TaxID=283816 RepID=A0ABV6GLP1_9BACI